MSCTKSTTFRCKHGYLEGAEPCWRCLLYAVTTAYSALTDADTLGPHPAGVEDAREALATAIAEATR